jgi:biotin-(acetyl-CoA carboxylase) ligase
MITTVDIFSWTQNYYTQQSLLGFLDFQSYEILDSTNSLAKQQTFLADTSFVSVPFIMSRPKVFLARQQTQGRGQYERVWSNSQNPEGQLLVTYSYFSKKAPQPPLTLALGLALHRSLVSTWPHLEPFLKVKKPNDLYFQGKKCSGLLIETISFGNSYHLIVGLGLNVTSYPKDLFTSTCLFNKDSQFTQDQEFILGLSTQDHHEGTALKSTEKESLTPNQWSLFLKQWDQARQQSFLNSWEELSPQEQTYLDKYRM